MTKRCAIATLTLFALLASSRSSAQTPEEPQRLPISIGAFGGATVNFLGGSIDMTANPTLGGGICGELGSGWGGGGVVGVDAEARVADRFGAGLRLTFQDLSGMMTGTPAETRTRRSDGSVATLINEYRFDLELVAPTVELFASYHLPALNSSLEIGPAVAFVGSPLYTTTEHLGEENEFTFANGTKSTTHSSGSLDRSLLFGFGVGADYALPMSRALELVFDIHVTGFPEPLVSGADGPMTLSFRPTLGFRYTPAAPRAKPPVLAVAKPVPPPAPPAPEMALNLEAYGIGPDGSLNDRILVTVHETVYRRETALLPYVFFERQSADIPDRYLKAPRAPADGATAVERYRTVLHTVGQRMQQAPGTRLTLVGSTQGDGAEKEDPSLAHRRAESVARYLVETYGIDRGRFDIQAQTVPSSPSNPDLEGGRAENRRVTLRESGSLLASLSVDSVARSYSSPGVAVEMQTSGLGSERSLPISGTAGTETVIRTSLPPESGRYDFDIGPLAAETVAQTGALSLQIEGPAGVEEVLFAASDLNADVLREREVVYLDEDGSTRLDTPILFPYDSDSLGPREQASLRSLAGQLPEGSSVVITGFADDLGGTRYNASLSLQRAERVAEFFSNFDVTTRAGEWSDSVSESETPEERFYKRTVSIEITTTR